MQKMFVIHYYINKQILDSYLHTKSEKKWLLFTFVLNWVFFAFFCGNEGHSEISKHQNYVYTCQTKFL